MFCCRALPVTKRSFPTHYSTWVTRLRNSVVSEFQSVATIIWAMLNSLWVDEIRSEVAVLIRPKVPRYDGPQKLMSWQQWWRHQWLLLLLKKKKNFRELMTRVNCQLVRGVVVLMRYLNWKGTIHSFPYTNLAKILAIMEKLLCAILCNTSPPPHWASSFLGELCN